MPVETSSESEASFSLTMGEDKVEKTDISHNAEVEVEFDKKVETDDEADKQATTDADPETSGDTEETRGDQAEGDEPSDAGEVPTFSEEDLEAVEIADLGEFNEETAEAFNKEFRLENGQLNTKRLTAEWWQNNKAGKEGLNDETYKYLESQGIPKYLAKDYEALAKAKWTSGEDANAAIFNHVGEDGVKTLGAALEWGKGGGYSKEAQARFNKVMEGKDKDAKLDAVDALMARYVKANPPEPEPAPKPPKVPKRDATRGNAQPGAPTVTGFKTVEEKRAFWESARGNPVKEKEYARKLKASNLGDNR